MGTIVPIMGTATARQELAGHTSLGNALFTQTQQKVLGLLFGQPSRSFYAKELIRLVGAGSGAVQRELSRLSQSGLLTVRSVGAQRHYQANPDSPIFDELRALVSKTFGLAEPLRAALSRFGAHVQAAFLYGSVAKELDTTASDIDLMVIADKLSYGDLVRRLEDATMVIGRPINPTVFSTGEFSRRRRNRDSFVRRVLAQPKLWLIGDEHEFPT